MSHFRNDFKEMRSYLLLWFTQMISGLGSAMTAYALVIWSYFQAGSALRTALLLLLQSDALRIWHLYIVNADGHWRMPAVWQRSSYPEIGRTKRNTKITRYQTSAGSDIKATTCHRSFSMI